MIPTSLQRLILLTSLHTSVFLLIVVESEDSKQRFSFTNFAEDEVTMHKIVIFDQTRQRCKPWNAFQSIKTFHHFE